MQILALHGFTGRGSDFAPFAERVGGVWHCPDLPGHGPEPTLDCTPETTIVFVEAQRATLDSRSPHAEPQHSTFNVQPSTLDVQVPHILLGYSMGARAALLHAVARPDAWDALILISPNPGTPDPETRAARRATDTKLAERIERGGTTAFIEFWQQTPMIRSQRAIRPDWRSAMQCAREAHTTEGLAASLRQFGQGQYPNLWPELTKLTMPTLLITGAHDRKYTVLAERMVTEISSRDLQPPKHAIIDEVGHMPHLEAPDATAKVICAFLSV